MTGFLLFLVAPYRSYCIEDYVGEDNPVRDIDAFVNQINMDKLGFKIPADHPMILNQELN